MTLSKLIDDQIELDIATRHKRPNRDQIWLRATDSARVANDNLAALSLVAPIPIRTLANSAFERALKAAEQDILALAEDGEALADAMRLDLAD